MCPLGPFIAVVLALVVCPQAASARGWERPVDGPALRPFSVAGDRFAAGQHRGVDLAAPPGTRVRAACGGRVSFAGRVPRGGLTVSVRCGRLVCVYQHLGTMAARRGQVVAPGARIGTVGGARPRPHVHLGARVRATGTYLDPLVLLAGAPRAGPPPLPGARRPRPLGPTPGARPVRVRPERARPVFRPLVLPRDVPAALRHPPARADRLPWPAWLGLALFALGLQVGGLVRLRERRRRTAAPSPQVAS